MIKAKPNFKAVYDNLGNQLGILLVSMQAGDQEELEINQFFKTLREAKDFVKMAEEYAKKIQKKREMKNFEKMCEEHGFGDKIKEFRKILRGE